MNTMVKILLKYNFLAFADFMQVCSYNSLDFYLAIPSVGKFATYFKILHTLNCLGLPSRIHQTVPSYHFPLLIFKN